MGNKLIPKQFNLGGRTYEVEYGGKDSDLLGQCIYNQCKIVLYEDNIVKDVLENTFFHELVHAILDSIGEHDLSKNERFVDAFGSALHQYTKSKK